MAAKPVYGRNALKHFSPRTSGNVLEETCQGLQPIIIFGHYDPGLTLTYFRQGLILHFRFLYRNGWFFGNYNNLWPENRLIYLTWWRYGGGGVSFIHGEHNIDIQGQDIKWAFTEPSVLRYKFSTENCHSEAETTVVFQVVYRHVTGVSFFSGLKWILSYNIENTISEIG